MGPKKILAAAGKHADEDHGLEVTSHPVEKMKSVISDGLGVGLGVAEGFTGSPGDSENGK